MKKETNPQQENTLSSKQLPSDVVVEKIVLGSLLIESSAIDRVAGFLKQEAFYDPVNEEIYSAILRLYNNGTGIDMLTVLKELGKSDKKRDDWPSIVCELTNNVSSTAHIEEHAMYIHELMIARKLILCFNMFEAKSFDRSLNIADIAVEALSEIESITSDTSFGAEAISIENAALQSIKHYENRKKLAESGIKNGIDTGLKDLNGLTNAGWKPGQLIILAARPSMGKTAMMLHFAKKAALAGTPAMIFSLEMGAQSLTNRVILSESDIDGCRFASGKLHNFEEDAYYNSVDNLRTLPMMIDDTPNASIQQIKIKARNAKRKGLCDIIFIDYLQLIDMRHANKSYNREQEVSQTSRSAKIMAKELDVPVILLSQLSRNVEGRADKTPLLSDLRESGAIEQDADVVLFVHRPEYYDDKAVKGEGYLIVAKQRDGATGMVEFKYNESLTRIIGREGKPF